MREFTIPKKAMRIILWCVERAYRRGYQHGLLAGENGKKHNDKDVLAWRFSRDYKFREAPMHWEERFRPIKGANSLQDHFFDSPDGLDDFFITEKGSNYIIELR